MRLDSLGNATAGNGRQKGNQDKGPDLDVGHCLLDLLPFPVTDSNVLAGVGGTEVSEVAVLLREPPCLLGVVGDDEDPNNASGNGHGAEDEVLDPPADHAREMAIDLSVEETVRDGRAENEAPGVTRGPDTGARTLLVDAIPLGGDKDTRGGHCGLEEAQEAVRVDGVSYQLQKGGVQVSRAYSSISQNDNR